MERVGDTGMASSFQGYAARNVVVIPVVEIRVVQPIATR